jgi:hypothetical protein
VAFKHIDDDAWEHTDDGSIHAAQMHRQLDNLEAISAERRPHASVKFARDNPFRACSVHPAAIGPLLIYLPEDEPWETVRVNIRYSDVTFENHVGTGDDAVLVCATLASPSGWWERPPVDADEGWTMLVEGATSFVTLDVPINSSAPSRWVCVYVWVWSVIDEANPVTKIQGNTFFELLTGGLDFNGNGPGAFTLPNPPERCIYQSAVHFVGGSEVSVESPAQFMYQDPGDADQTYTQPPLLNPTGSLADGYDVRTMGVVHIEGISVWGIPEESQIAEMRPLLNSKRPCAWYAVQPVAQTVERLATTRTRQYGCHVGIGETGNNNASLWSIRSDVLANGLTTTDQIVAQSGLIYKAPVDSDGYRCMFTFALRAFLERNTVYGARNVYNRDVKLVFQMKSYDAYATPGAGTLNASGSDYPANVRGMPPLRSYGNNVPQPLNATLTALEGGLSDWQYRGLLAFREGVSRGGSDIDELKYFEIDIPEAGIVYPMVLTVEARLASAIGASTTFAVISRAFRSVRVESL